MAKQARERALSNRKLGREGGDPLGEKRRAEGMPTFADAAARVVEQKRDGWRSRVHVRTWLDSLALHAFPRIGRRPVSEGTSADMLEVLTPIWHVKAQTARNVRQRISAVMECAIAMNLRLDNPCARVLPVLGKQNEAVQHMRALPHRDVAAVVAAVRASNAAEAVRLAFEFLVLTAARWGEVRGAQWTETDTANGVWTIPAARMKATREHRVPLCRRAVKILDAARALSDGGEPLVFAGNDGEPLDEKVQRRLLERLRVAAVPHGFRSSFRDWAAEETDHPREVIEAALAHVVPSKVEAAYARSDLFARRRLLMDDWSAYLNTTSTQENPWRRKLN